MSGDLDMGANDVTNVGFVDGVDVSVLAAAFSSHAADASIHFTEASIDHGNITGLGDDDHTQYLLVDGTRAMSGNLDMGTNNITNVGTVDGVTVSTHDHSGAGQGGTVAHASLSGVGTNTHAQIDTHIADATIHFTEGSIDHGSISGLLDDDHTQYLLLVGRPGGQVVFGGTAVANTLTLNATSDAGGGLIEANHPIRINYIEGNTTPAEMSALIWEPVHTTAGAFLGQLIRNDADISYTNAFYIYASVLDRSIHRAQISAGFAAFTLFNALPQINNDGNNVNLVQMLILNDGGVHERTSSGTSTTPQHITVSSSPQIRTLVSGAVMTWTIGAAGLLFAPKFSTVAGSTVNMGTLRGLHCQIPGAALFAPSAGVENMTAYYAVDVDNLGTFGGTAPVAALRSAIAAGTGQNFLLNTGGANSAFGGGNLLNCGFVQCLADNVGLSLGAAGGDMILTWNGTAYEWDPLIGNLLTLNFATTDTYIWQAENFGTDAAELRCAFDLFSFGQSGAVGNQTGVFVAQARTVPVPGGYAAWLLTVAGNLDINGFAMSDVSAWVINPLSITLSGGSITDVATLRMSMTTSGLGGARTAALYQTGRRTLRGVDEPEPLSPAALTGNVNDYAPATGNSMRQVWRLTTDDLAVRNITGLAVQQRNDTQWITNVGTVDVIILQHQNAGSAAGNRIISPTGADYTLAPNASALLWHDDVTNRWRILWGTGV